MNDLSNINNERDDKPDDVILCPGCIAENGRFADFCHNCGMPISSFATMDPLKHIYAQGWMYRKACSGRTSPIIVIGMWLIFAPTLFVTCRYLYELLFPRFGTQSMSHTNTNVLVFVFFLAFVLLYVAILYRVTKRYLHVRNIKPGHCEHCGYDLSGLPEPRCPECGNPFHPDDVYSDDSE